MKKSDDEVVEAVARAICCPDATDCLANAVVPNCRCSDYMDEARDAIAAHDTALKAQVETLREAHVQIAFMGYEGAPDIQMRRISRAALAATEPKP